MKNFYLNLENYLIDPNDTELTVNIRRTGDNVCYETACCTLGHLSNNTMILYLHFMQRSHGKGGTLDFGELLRSAPMGGELLQSAVVELLFEGYLTYTISEDGRITSFEFCEHPDMDLFVA